MSDNSGVNINKVQLENYKFSGIDASLVGAIKSVADYYQLPLTTSWIYGMTGGNAWISAESLEKNEGFYKNLITV